MRDLSDVSVRNDAPAVKSNLLNLVVAYILMTSDQLFSRSALHTALYGWNGGAFKSVQTLVLCGVPFQSLRQSLERSACGRYLVDHSASFRATD